MNANEKYRLISNICQQKFPFFAGILAKIELMMDDAWRAELVDDLEALFGDVQSLSFAKALEGYAEFSIDAMRNQEYFLKHGRYRASTFSEVKRNLLENAEHMLGNYLPGMFVSHYFWPHHYKMARHYRKEILPKVRERNPGLFVEVGTGSAMYTRLTMAELPEVHGIGYDISPHSISFGRRVARAFHFDDRIALVEQDAFLDPPEDKADYIVSQEVVEHLEDPLTFCKNLREILKAEGFAYITAAITAAHSDHIFLFNSPEEFESMLKLAGFRSVLSVCEASLDTRVAAKTPRIAGHLLVKA